MAKVFVVYQHRLFHDILITALADHSIVGSAACPTEPLAAVVDAVNRSRANIVVLEGATDGKTAWHIALTDGDRRVIAVDMERGVAQDYSTRTSAIGTLDDLAHFLEDKPPGDSAPGALRR